MGSGGVGGQLFIPRRLTGLCTREAQNPGVAYWALHICRRKKSNFLGESLETRLRSLSACIMNDGIRFRSRETMVVQSATRSSPPPRSKALTRKFMEHPKVPFAVALAFADAILAFLIIAIVPYTKIDWNAYMSQVTGFLGGYNHTKWYQRGKRLQEPEM